MNENGKVLIIEDDSSYAEILRRVIAKNDYEVKVAHDGEEGLRQINEWKPDVIIVDWMMPGMTGIEVVKKIKEHPDLKFSYVIMLTSRVETEDKAMGFEAGADDFITKPVDFTELVARIRVGFRMKKFQTEIAELQHEVALLEMARTLGHEINNPLSIIYLSLEFVERSLKEGNIEKVRENLNKIYQASERIKSIVNSLVSLRKPTFKDYVDGRRMLDLNKE